MRNLIKPVLLVVALLPVSMSVTAEPPHKDTLPPGLQKKADRGEPLPPGWQKKLDGYERGDYLDAEFLRYGRVRDLDDRRQRVEVEDKVYTIIKDTREIVDVLRGRR